MRLKVKKVSEANFDDWSLLKNKYMNQNKSLESKQEYFSSKINHCPVWIAYVGKKPVGFIECSIHENDPWYKGRKAFLEVIYVIPELHKRGIATRLVYIALKWTKKRKLNYMGSSCHYQDEVAVKMLTGFAFQYIKTIDGQSKFIRSVE